MRWRGPVAASLPVRRDGECASAVAGQVRPRRLVVLIAIALAVLGYTQGQDLETAASGSGMLMSASGSASGSGMLMGGTDDIVCGAADADCVRCVDAITETTALDDAPSESELIAEGKCHIECLNKMVKDAMNYNATENQFPGYPAWDIIPDSYWESDCTLTEKVLACNEGCKLRKTITDVAKCTKTCKRSCCGGGSFFCPAGSCNIYCDNLYKSYCESGCSLDQNNALSMDYPLVARPNIQYTCEMGSLTVDISNSIPSNFSERVPAVLLIKIEKLEYFTYYSLLHSSEDYLVLLSDLSECAEVNVSLAVVSPRYSTRSKYSHPVLVNTSAVLEAREPLYIVENIQGIDQRSGFFGFFTLELTWEEPSYQPSITHYEVNITSGASFSEISKGNICDMLTFNVSKDATSLLFEADSAETDIFTCSNDCPYSIVEIVSLPDPCQGEIKTEAHFSHSTCEDFTDHNFKCLKQYDPNSVRYSISVVWSIPASVAAAVNQYTFGASLRGNDDGSIAILQPPKAFPHSVMEGNQYAYTFNNIEPKTDKTLKTDIQTMWRSSYLQRFDMPPMSFPCTFDIPPKAPTTVSDLEVLNTTIVPSEESAINTYSFVIMLHLSWTPPLHTNGELTQYEVWVGLRTLGPLEDPNQNLLKIDHNLDDTLRTFTLTIEVDYSEVAIPTPCSETAVSCLNYVQFATVYSQVRSYNSYDLKSDWSAPDTFELAKPIPPSPPKLVSVNNAEVHGSTPMGNGVFKIEVMLDVSWVLSTVPAGEQLTFEVWTGQNPLLPGEEPDNPDQITSINTDFSDTNKTITVDILVDISEPLAGLRSGRALSEVPETATVYVQVRAVNEFGSGNWSNPSPFEVGLPPTPKAPELTSLENTVIQSTEAIDEKNSVYKFVISFDLLWALPSSIEHEIDSYVAVVVFSPLKQLEPSPTDTPVIPFEAVVNKTSREITLSITIHFDNVTSLNNTEDSAVLYVQMYASNLVGRSIWSQPLTLSVQRPTIPFPAGSIAAIVICSLIALVLLSLIIIVACVLYKRRLIGGGYIMEKDGEDNFIDFEKVPTFEMSHVDTWEIPMENIVVYLDKKLGEGAFGEVYKGTIRGPIQNPKISFALQHTLGVTVAIKVLKPSASRKEKADFFTEIETMKKITEGNNPHIVNMIGCVTRQEPIVLMTEFVQFGDLLSYLRSQQSAVSKRKPEPQKELAEQAMAKEEEGEESMQQQSGGYTTIETTNAATVAAPYLETLNEYSHLDDKPEDKDKMADKEGKEGKEGSEEEAAYTRTQYLGDLEPDDLVKFAYQIAVGMEHLASLKIVHRDLACRNILIGEGKSLKITDFGLSREVEEVYEITSGKRRLPWKWMALESIQQRKFTIETDVWSYGIALWEIATLGGFPYPMVANQDLPGLLKSGYRMEKPDNCAPEVYNIMLQCWNEEPKARPSFSKLRSMFESILSSQQEYITLTCDMDQECYKPEHDEEDTKGNSKEEEAEPETVQKPEMKKMMSVTSQSSEGKAALSNPYVGDPAVIPAKHKKLNLSSSLLPTSSGHKKLKKEVSSKSVVSQGGNQQAYYDQLIPTRARDETGQEVDAVPLSALSPPVSNPYVDTPSGRDSD